MNKKTELIQQAVRRGKYASLYHFLAGQGTDHIEMTFAELEKILGFKLPDSAYLYRPWWANQSKSGHSQSMAWDAAGWKTKLVDLETETLMFDRIVAKNEVDATARKNAISLVSQNYWVYENWTHKKAIIHSGQCSFCKHGNGVQAGSTNRNGQWWGPFNSFEQAQKVAISTRRDEIRSCNICI